MDRIYDGCTDAFVPGDVISSDSNIVGVLLAGSCSGRLRATALSLPQVVRGDAVAHDSDHDILVDFENDLQ